MVLHGQWGGVRPFISLCRGRCGGGGAAPSWSSACEMTALQQGMHHCPGRDQTNPRSQPHLCPSSMDGSPEVRVPSALPPQEKRASDCSLILLISWTVGVILSWLTARTPDAYLGLGCEEPAGSLARIESTVSLVLVCCGLDQEHQSNKARFKNV